MKKWLKYWWIAVIVILVAAPLMYCFCPISMNTTIFTINGRKVSMQEYCYTYDQYKYSVGDDDYWNKTATNQEKNELRLVTVVAIKRQVAVEQFLDSKGIELTESDLAYIDSYYEKQVAKEGGQEKWAELLYDNSLTEKLYKANVALQVRMNRYIYENNSTFSEGVYRAKHILLKFYDDGGHFEDDAIEPMINGLYDQLEQGADFDTLMKQYSEDTGLEDYPDGYYFTDGQMVKEFEETTKSLEVGEYSAPVKSTYGYHIILRLPVDEEEVIHTLDEIISDTKCFDDLYVEAEPIMVNATVKYNYFAYLRISPRTVVFKDKSK